VLGGLQAGSVQLVIKLTEIGRAALGKSFDPVFRRDPKPLKHAISAPRDRARKSRRDCGVERQNCNDWIETDGSMAAMGSDVGVERRGDLNKRARRVAAESLHQLQGGDRR